MNTVTKVIGAAGIITLIAIGMRKKKSTTTTTPASQQIKNIPDYEGKLVVQDNGNWFVVKDGKRWFTGSVEAIMDFQRAYPGNDIAIQNVPEIDLARYPISGEIQAGLSFIPYPTKLGNPFPTIFRGV